MLAPLIAAGLAGPLHAKALACVFGDLSVSFAIDRNQFVNPHNLKDPPRNKITDVLSGSENFAAEPFVMATGQRGFYARDHDVMLVIQPDGTATYVAAGNRLTGTCEEQ